MAFTWVQGGYFGNDVDDSGVVNYTGGGTVPNTALTSASFTAAFVTAGLNPVGVGHNVCVMVGGGPSGLTNISVTDDKGNSYVSLSSSVRGNYEFQNNTYPSSIFYATNITNSPTQLIATFNNTGGLFIRLLFDEFSGPATLDQFVKNQDTGGTGTCTSGTATTLKNGEFIWGACSDSFFGTHGVSNNLVEREFNNTDFLLTGSQSQLTAGPISTNFTTASGQNSWTYMLTFYPFYPWVPFPQ